MSVSRHGGKVKVLCSISLVIFIVNCSNVFFYYYYYHSYIIIVLLLCYAVQFKVTNKPFGAVYQFIILYLLFVLCVLFVLCHYNHDNKQIYHIYGGLNCWHIT